MTLTHCTTRHLDFAMDETIVEWEARLAAHWAAFDGMPAEAFVTRLDELAAELPLGSAVALYERGSGQDSTGRPEVAVPLYRAALAALAPALPRYGRSLARYAAQVGETRQ